MKKAFVTGITGQDGSYLAELLLQKGYKVYGFVRKKCNTNRNTFPLTRNIKFCVGDLSDFQSIVDALKIAKPDEIYNLASQSHPGESWQKPLETGDVTGLGAHRLFEAARQHLPNAKIYQASSSEMYGNAVITPQNEQTPFNPVNPYAVAKTYAHQMAQIYKNTHGMFIACGILFNHESLRRDMGFVTQKVAYGAACAKLGIINSAALNESNEAIVKDGKLSIGNLHASRDWGYAPDYVEAMYLMLQEDVPDNFVIGTGISRSIEDLCQTAFGYVGLDWNDFVITDKRFARPVDTLSLRADTEKVQRVLNWRHKTNFEDMIRLMVDAHLEKLRGGAK